jgi:uncharacterized iron-regulated membrane protein
LKRFRKVVFWCHLIVGVSAGLVILLMSFTGVLLTYERQILHWADTRQHQVAPPAPGAARLPIDSLLDKVRAAQPGSTLTSLTVRAGATEPAAVALAGNPGGNRTVFVDPYTGIVLGEGSKRVREFFRFVTDWHRWLGMQGTNRSTGRAITGACNLGFLLIVLSGFYLWWPRNWSQVRRVLWFRRGLPGKARDFNWHNVIGFWSLAPLFVIVLSGVVISYPWAGNLVYRVVGETPPAPARPATGTSANNAATRQSRPERSSETVSPIGLESLWQRAEQQTSAWQSISLRLPNTPEAPLTFTIDQGTGGQPHKRAQLTLDRATGAVVKWEPFSSFTTGRRLRSILRFAHTGEVAGVAGQTLAGVVSAGAVVLVWTGLALAYRRWRAWLARRRQASVNEPRVTEPVAFGTE